MWSNVFEQPQNTAFSPSTDLMRKHYGKCTSQKGFRLCQLETQIWFEDEKLNKHNVLSHSWFLVAIRGQNKSCCFLCVFLSSSDVLSKLLICPLYWKIWKSLFIYPSIDPTLKEIRTWMVESGQKTIFNFTIFTL